MSFKLKLLRMLDNKAKILQLDSKNMLGSIQLLGQQIEEVLALATKVKIQASYKKVNNIVVLGMGGSALGAHFIKSVFLESLKIPLEIVNGYKAPEFVNEKSLVIASSYSGSTEEIISSVVDAKNKKAKIIAICSGGKLADWAKQSKVPALIFTTNNNPCGSPRMGLGYSIFGQVALLANAGILKLPASEIKNATQTISKFNSLFGVDNPEEKNAAKQMATSLLGKSAWFAAAEHLAGNAHIAANQMNENAKRFGGYFAVPEMNHHLMEGLLFPENNKQNIQFCLLESKLYDQRVQKRYGITKQILDKNNIGNFSYKCQEKNKFLQACEALVLFSYVSFYSAMLQGIDPTAIPVVDFFKEQLKK